MFLNDLIRRRIAAQLRPWLRDEPELELKFGLFHSNGTLSNVSFNTSALNELLEDCSRFCFKEVTVDRLSLKFSPWSAAAFTLEVHGLRFVVSVGEEEDESGVKWRRKPKDTTLEEKNKVLAEIDSEGCDLHDAIKRIAEITPRTWRKSLLNTLYRYCQLQLHDTIVFLKSPYSSNTISCSLKEVGVKSQITGHRCFVQAFTSALFMPSDEISVEVNINSFEVKVNGANRTTSVVPATHMSALVNMEKSQFRSFYFRVPKLHISFSPADISVVLLFYALLSKKSKYIRSGRQLWNILAIRTGSKLSLVKVVKIVCLWLRYVKTYRNLLLLIGYHAEGIMGRSATLMYQNKPYSRSVKCQWKLIAEFENDLPPEAITFARKLIRFNISGKNDSYDELLVGKRFFSWRILSVIGSLFQSISRILYLHKVLALFQKNSEQIGTVQEDGISLIVQEISVSIYPDNAEKAAAISYQDLYSVRLSIDLCFLRHVVNVSEQFFMFGSVGLKILSLSLPKESAKKKLEQKIVWGEPAKFIHFHEGRDGISAPLLDSLLGKLWVNWEESCSRIEEENIPNLNTPWILCELGGGFLKDSKCGMILGRLNLDLDYFSIATILVVIRQMQSSLFINDDIALGDPPVTECSSEFRSYSRKIELDILKKIPQKNIQMGVLITGPHIQLSLLNNRVSFDVCNIEIIVSPNLEGNLGLSSEKEFQEIDNPKSDNEAYSSQRQISSHVYIKIGGLKGYFDESAENKKYEIVVLSPTIAQLRYVRKDHYSFGSTIVALSAASHLVANGFTMLLFLDEWDTLTKVIFGLFYESLAFTNNGSGGGLIRRELSSRKTSYSDSCNEETLSTQFLVHSTLELKSLGLITHNSRKNHSLENGIYISAPQLTTEFIFKEGNMDLNMGMTGIRSIIFRYSNDSGRIFDKSELKYLLSSLNLLTEASISQFKLRFVVNAERIGDRWLSINTSISGIYMVECQVKDILMNEHKLEEFSVDFLVGGEFQTISWRSKGGAVLIESVAAAMFIKCCTLYYQRILVLWSANRSSGQGVIARYSRDITAHNGHLTSTTPQQVQQVTLDRLEVFSMSLLHFSLVFVERDESGRLQELLFQVDFHFNLDQLNTPRKISMNISKFCIFSRLMHERAKHKPEVTQSPLLSLIVPDASDSSSISQNGIRVGEKKLQLSQQNYIMEDFRCSLFVERPVNNIWAGNGSISGFDMTISLWEIKTILSAYEFFSEVSIREKVTKLESGQRSNNQEQAVSTEEMIPDGTIVAIHDVDQHMYIAVENSESKYDTVGTIHYSLVGERALFRVKYHKSRWKSQVQYFSLISLYAKDESGKSLRLNCNQRSRFVEISSSDDSGPALWRTIPFKPDVYEETVELESSRTFHLVNKKNDCALAFLDGVLEFVSKPGNLFKWKVFNDPGPTGNNLSPEGILGITITLEKATLTIVDVLPDAEKKIPLLQAVISPNQTIVQISKSKIRVMNKLEFVLCYFDAQRNSWREFVQPLELSCFYSSKFLAQDLENILPSHFIAKIKEVNLSVNELLLDILLFVIGKLDLAGPYAVKRSVILTNCCKVENQSGLTLICQFYDNHTTSISAGQSTTISLRQLALANQHPEASFVSLQLGQQGVLSTIPIRLSILETQKFAWRTRIMSSQDSKSFPGPLIVVQISRESKDGLSIIISPLLKIHNGTDFCLDLRFQRPQHKEMESASLLLKSGNAIDDCTTAFSAVDLSGELRKVLTSLSVGNFIFSFKPKISDISNILINSSVQWSHDLKGGKPVRLFGVFDKLNYKLRKTFSVDKVKYSITSASCALKSEESFLGEMHFLILTVEKGIPIINPNKFGDAQINTDSPVALQEQKEIFVLPTIQVSNLLHTEIHVNLTDRDPRTNMEHDNPWNRANIPCGSCANFYANPSNIHFSVTLIPFNSSCKPVNSNDWMKRLQKQKKDIPHLDIELEFGGGKYFAILRLSRGQRGTLEAAIFTLYALQNDTNDSIFCFSANQKPLSRDDKERFGSDISPELGSYLVPNAITSWFMKSHKLRLKLLDEKALEAQLDLDALSGLTEIDLEKEELFGLKDITRLGVSLRPSIKKEILCHIVSLHSRYIICNESEEAVTIRQYYMEEMEESITLNSKQKTSLRLKRVTRNRRDTNVIENLLRKHTKSQDDLSLFIQFRLNETDSSWSGPVCVASLGRFFLKFRKPLEFPENQLNRDSLSEFAFVHVVEEGPTIVLHFHKATNTNLPYRIENSLRETPVIYYQQGLSEPETLGAGVSTNYVWDDLTLPHKLVIQLNGVRLLREINLDKVRAWKPFYRNKQNRGLGFHLPPLESKTETVNVGYEIYAEGVTRVLRICDFSDSHKKMDFVHGTSRKMRMRISYFSVHLLEHTNQEVDLENPSNESPIIIARFERIKWDSMLTKQQVYNQIRIQALSVDEKWAGAPFSAMLRRHQSENSDTNDYILHVAIVLLPSNSTVKQVKFLSIVLQPLTLNLDEETLMKIVPFWRKSLSESIAPRQQYYFDHFEIHPIKIVASFLPGDSYYSYSSTQETLRSLLHSVIKMPAIKSQIVELNGVLVTHALITLRELTIKCFQHYSWYSMRAIYMAKGSPLLPPAFASLFDDLASSSLDVFFDPSRGLFNLPGVTLGTLKLISKFIDNKGFSGTKRYFGDLEKTLKTAGSNILFAAVTEVSDSILKGAETSGFNGMVAGFRQGILKLAMEPSVLSSVFMEGGPDRKIKLDRSPGVDELYIEGYLQAMLDTMYKQEYLRVRIIDNQVILKNLPPSSALINEIMECVKGFLASKALLKGESSTASLRHIRGEREWRIGPTVLTLCEHLFVSFAIRFLRKQSGKVIGRINWKAKISIDEEKSVVPVTNSDEQQKVKLIWRWGIGQFFLSGIVAYIDGRLCRNIPNPVARRIVSGFLLSFLDKSDDDESKSK